MKILVIDIETLGFDPAIDAIAEIGVVSLDLDTHEILDEFYSLLNEYDKPRSPSAWIFSHSNLKFKEMVEKGVQIEEIRPKLQQLFDTYSLTSYNQAFDFRFLKDRKFKIEKIAPDPMLIATDVLQIHHEYYGVKYPKVQECLDFFELNEQEPHRALLDARQEAKIIVELIKRKKYHLVKIC
jgi:DNA polymerase III epsilon subunit-like protein